MTVPSHDRVEVYDTDPTPLYVRIPRWLHVHLKGRAEEEERSVAAVVRRALTAYLGEPVKEAK